MLLIRSTAVLLIFGYNYSGPDSDTQTEHRRSRCSSDTWRYQHQTMLLTLLFLYSSVRNEDVGFQLNFKEVRHLTELSALLPYILTEKTTIMK